jgi:hypothetical protein
MELDTFADLPELVNLGASGFVSDHSSEHFGHPVDTFSARRALSTTFVLVKIHEARDASDEVGFFAHNDDCGCAAGSLVLDEVAKVHRNCSTSGNSNF